MSNTISKFDVTDCPYYLISRATLVATSALKKGFADYGVGEIKPSYLGVLISLWEKDGTKAVELGRLVCLEPSSMTGLLDRMERDGLIYRAADPDDRRAQNICLTEKGKSVREPVLKAVTITLRRIFSDVSPEEIKTMKRVLHRVLASASEGE